MLRNSLIVFLFLALLQGCSQHSYPCPDIRGGTEVVKAGSNEGLKKVEPDYDSNGRLEKKPYAHPGMKKKRK
jgi:hypothetical protein